jgi:hypothetical protein
VCLSRIWCLLPLLSQSLSFRLSQDLFSFLTEAFPLSYLCSIYIRVWLSIPLTLLLAQHWYRPQFLPSSFRFASVQFVQFASRFPFSSVLVNSQFSRISSIRSVQFYRSVSRSSSQFSFSFLLVNSSSSRRFDSSQFSSSRFDSFQLKFRSIRFYSQM